MPTVASPAALKPAKPAAPSRLSKSKRAHKRRLKQAARKNAGTPA